MAVWIDEYGELGARGKVRLEPGDEVIIKLKYVHWVDATVTVEDMDNVSTLLTKAAALIQSDAGAVKLRYRSVEAHVAEIVE